MDIQTVTSSIPSSLATSTTLPQASTTSGADYQNVAVGVSTSAAYDITDLGSLNRLATTQTDTTVDLSAEDAALGMERILQSQQTVLSALRSGGMDAALLLSGLPPGATATLLGGGWAQPLPGLDPATTEALWAFHLPYRRQDVPAVTSSTRTDPANDKEKPAAGSRTPLSGYGPQGEREPVPGEAEPSTLDILD